MKIPHRLEELLKKDRTMRAVVDGAIGKFDTWIRDNKLPFFPDYTDHGIDHIEQVLVTMSLLIHDNAWDILTARDSGILIITCLLHDSAMHMSKDSFIALVSDDQSHIEGMDTTRWPQLWHDYLFSAKRWDERTLIDIFGDTTPVQVPVLDRLEMNERNQLFIGEFLRRHHSRLAHEIAVFGLPTHEGRKKLIENMDDRLINLAGLIARSHGMPLRAVFPYMNARRIDKPRYLNVHPIFLMALIRIADYLQIQSERAPRELLEIKKIRSPFSLREHEVHQSIDDIYYSGPDTEAIEIRASPPNVKTFLRLKEWLSGIQNELDTSWAVLGEVYARNGMSQLGLTIRRVRSNLDDREDFAGSVSYVPKRIEFDVERAEILKLLVGPLYGNDPAIGIRELMQNAVDAVRERWDFQEQNPEFKDVQVLEQEGDVEIWLDEPNEEEIAWLTISDKGIGMTEEVIKDYFLKVGASYRQSDTWSKQHEIRDFENGGKISAKSRVLRTGRFGIGALAAYLLGNEIEVSTRHIDSVKGLRFTTKLDSEAINLTVHDDLKVGTTIRIPVTNEAYATLMQKEEWEWYEEELDGEEWNGDNWDWYCLNKPVVRRLFGHDRKVLKQRIILPDCESGFGDNWYEIKDTLFQKVHCNYRGTNKLICNGIEIRGEKINLLDNGAERLSVQVRSPLISISDPDGKLELNLTRTAVDENARIRSEYRISRFRYALALLLAHAPSKFVPHYEPAKRIVRSNIFSPNFNDEITVWPWFYTRHGIALNDQWNIGTSSIRRCLVLPLKEDISMFSSLWNSNYDAVFSVNCTRKIEPDRELKGYSELLTNGFERTAFHVMDSLDQTGSRLITTSDAANTIIEHINIQRKNTHDQIPEIQKESVNGKWVFLTVGRPPSTNVTAELLDSLQISDSNLPLLIGEWFLASDQSAIEPRGLAKEWKEIIREPVIPYNLEERREKLAHAYKELAPYLESIEKPEDL